MKSVFRPTSMYRECCLATETAADTTRCDGQPVLLQGQYSYSVHLQQYYSAEYEYTIWPTIRPE